MSMPNWFPTLLGAQLPGEGGRLLLAGQAFTYRGGILRGEETLSDAQQQTADVFGFKWHKRETFESTEMLAGMRAWLIERYGDVAAAPWLAEHGPAPVLLDAGCGGAMSAIELFGPILHRMRFIGVDVSAAVEVAAARFAERGFSAAFVQCSLAHIPLPPASVDLIFSEGVLHHTDSTQAALNSLVPLLKRGGRILFYVYRRKGPIREFTDDYIRDTLQSMSPQQAWEVMLPLTKLGKTLGELSIEIEIAEPIDLLGIPAGRMDLQRFFYWHVAKAFYRPDVTIDEMNHINFDWYAPKNAHRQSPDEVRGWCAAAGLVVERERIEDAGITIIARRER